MRNQITLSEADGRALCHQPLTTNPAAPARFIAWNVADWPVTRPIVTRR